MYSIILPDVTVLGQKDGYLSFVFKSLIKQLGFPIKVVITPIIRNSDGLAYSSRNRFLSDSERQNATSVYQVLHEISRWSSYPSVEKIKGHIINRITNANGEIDYIQICCFKTLKSLDVLDRKAIIIINAKFDEIEMGDNIIIEP